MVSKKVMIYRGCSRKDAFLFPGGQLRVVSRRLSIEARRKKALFSRTLIKMDRTLAHFQMQQHCDFILFILLCVTECMSYWNRHISFFYFFTNFNSCKRHSSYIVNDPVHPLHTCLANALSIFEPSIVFLTHST